MYATLLKMFSFLGVFQHFETNGIWKIAGGTLLLNIFATFVWPDLAMLQWVIVAVSADFITGLLKVIITVGFKGISSEKARKSVSKGLQYGFLLGLMVLLSSSTYVADHKIPVDFLVNAVCSLLVIIECISIIENLGEMDPKSEVNKYVFRPLLRFLKFRRNKISEAIDDKKQDPEDPAPIPPPVQ